MDSIQIATKSPIEFPIELVQFILKSIWKSKCAKLAKEILKKINEEGLALQYSCLWHESRNKQEDRQTPKKTN